MGGCSVTPRLFLSNRGDVCAHFQNENADHILLLKAQVSLLPGETAAHGGAPPTPTPTPPCPHMHQGSLVKGQHV